MFSSSCISFVHSIYASKSRELASWWKARPDRKSFKVDARIQLHSLFAAVVVDIAEEHSRFQPGDSTCSPRPQQRPVPRPLRPWPFAARVAKRPNDHCSHYGTHRYATSGMS